MSNPVFKQDNQGEIYIRFEEYYCDGTTLLADTNKHKVTWKKNLERYRSNVEERIAQGKESQEAGRKPPGRSCASW